MPNLVGTHIECSGEVEMAEGKFTCLRCVDEVFTDEIDFEKELVEAILYS